MGYELYADIWFLTNFTMDGIALFAAGKLMRQRISIGRLLLGCLVGTCGSGALFLWMDDYFWYQALVHLAVNPAMVFLCFRSRGAREFFEQWAAAYVAVFLLGGVLEWCAGAFHGERHIALCLSGAFSACLLSEKLLSGRGRRAETVCDVLLVTREKNISAKGFYDTGNLLVDPFVGRPVHIVRKDVLAGQIEKEGLPVRLIPFHSLGEENGLLEAVTLEGMYVMRGKRPLYLENPVFGIAEAPLFQDGRCDVILNGRL